MNALLSAAMAEAGRLGGQARAKALTKEQLSKIGRKAGKASGRARRRNKIPTKSARLLESLLHIATDDCVNWTGAKSRYGHGRIRIGRKLILPHRIAYETKYGRIPPRKHLHHLCNNPACVNIRHLKLLDASEHMRLSRLGWRKKVKIQMNDNVASGD